MILSMMELQEMELIYIGMTVMVDMETSGGVKLHQLL